MILNGPTYLGLSLRQGSLSRRSQVESQTYDPGTYTGLGRR